MPTMTRALWIALACLVFAGVGAGAWRVAAAPKREAPDPRCAAPRIAEARATFKVAYGAGRYDDAASALADIWSSCADGHHLLPSETAAEIASDLAIADHHAGDDRECLEALMDYWPANRDPPAAFKRLSPALQKAMRFNWGLCSHVCGGGAADYDAVCTSLEINDDREKRERGFSPHPCPFHPGSSGVALADGRCLVILAPRQSYDPSTADSADPHAVCPAPALLEKVGARTVTTRLTAPAKSFLNSLQFCCHPVTLGVDRAGRIAAEPGKDAQEGCLSGHYPGTMQDIFRLQGGRVVMVKQLAEPWFAD